MDLAGIDRTLGALRSTVAAMSTNLVDLESDPVRTRLDQTTLSGTTAARWAEARAALGTIWQWFGQLNDLLQKATELRGTRTRLDPGPQVQLDAMVNGPSIELSKSDVPLAERGLFGPSQTVVRCTPGQLLDRMRQTYDQVLGVIGASSQRWVAADASLAPLDRQLAEALRLVEQSSQTAPPTLERTRTQLDQWRRSVASDPLGTAGLPVEEIAASLGSLCNELARSEQVRGGLSTRLADAVAALAALQATIREAETARTEAIAKIAAPAVLDPPSTTSLEQELGRAQDLSARGEWRPAANLLEQWDLRLRDLDSQAQRALAANRAPIQTRDELRGRLDAYRGKAYRLGLLEDPAVAGLYAEAQRVLFIAPSDLAAAEDLLRRYQHALVRPAHDEVPR